MKYALPRAGEFGSVECVGRLQVSRCRILDIRNVDKIRAVADTPQPARPSTSDQPRNEMMVPRPPNQMRSQRAGGESIAVGRQHGPLRPAPCSRVVALFAAIQLQVRQCLLFVDAALILPANVTLGLLV